jgi:hypothetical protein
VQSGGSSSPTVACVDRWVERASAAPMTSAAIPIMTTGGRKMWVAFAAIRLAEAIGINVLALAILDREH